MHGKDRRGREEKCMFNEFFFIYLCILWIYGNNRGKKKDGMLQMSFLFFIFLVLFYACHECMEGVEGKERKLEV